MPVLRGRFGANQANDVVVAVGVGGPDFGAVDAIGIALRRCCGAHRG